MTELSTSRNLEIQPTFTAFRFGSFDADVGKAVDGKPRPEGGANFKYGVTSNLIADFTLNPDFSQIESDRPQVEVNQRFALFFPELRPFFLEGAEIFQIQAPVTVVHTRTIVDPLYGAKLTGKAGKTTLGVLYTNDEGASLGIDDPFNPAFDQSAQTFVGRVRYDLYSESFIGAIFTDREFLDGYSRLAGLDSNFRVGDTHQLGFRALGTQHLGDDTLQSDGYLMDFGFRKRGRNLSYSIDAFSLSPDFKTDIGFVRRTDMQRYDTSIQYQWWPESWVLSWGPQVRYGQNYNFDQVLEDENLSAGLSGNFAKNIRANLTANRDMGALRRDQLHQADLPIVWQREHQSPHRVRGVDSTGATRSTSTAPTRFSVGKPPCVCSSASGPCLDSSPRSTSARAGSATRAGSSSTASTTVSDRRERTDLRRQDLPRAEHVSIHRPAAVPEHHRGQHLRRDARTQLPLYLSR